MLQIAIVAVVVASCFVYALWTLLPAAARRWLARTLLEHPLPGFVARALRPYTVASSGCDGCDHAPSKRARPSPSPAAAAPLTFRAPGRRWAGAKEFLDDLGDAPKRPGLS